MDNLSKSHSSAARTFLLRAAPGGPPAASTTSSIAIGEAKIFSDWVAVRASIFSMMPVVDAPPALAATELDGTIKLSVAIATSFSVAAGAVFSTVTTKAVSVAAVSPVPLPCFFDDSLDESIFCFLGSGDDSRSTVSADLFFGSSITVAWATGFPCFISTRLARLGKGKILGQRRLGNMFWKT